MTTVHQQQMLILAQLVAPPIQSGPVRLPETRSFEHKEITPPILIEIRKASPFEQNPLRNGTGPTASPGNWIPVVQGTTPYTEQELKSILTPCAGSRGAETLQTCAATLSAKLTSDGYVNSRVFTSSSPTPGLLDVVEGKLVEIQVNSDDKNLQDLVRKKLNQLLGTVLH